ncbi:MAG: TIM barrel protein [Eubacteriales bacterium]
MIRFGPSGNSEEFYADGYNHTYEAMKWIYDKGLNAYEYSFGRGVRINSETAAKIKDEVKKYGIAISAHAPYYINLATTDETKAKNNIGYILSSASAVKMMGGNRVIIHPGTSAGIDREVAFTTIHSKFREIIKILDGEGFEDILLCPETMGKINQVGTLEEVVKLCQIDMRIIPTIDFGHLYARTLGGIQGEEDYIAILDFIEKELGSKRASIIHCHFSKIEFTQSGEKKHLTFESKEFGPDFKPLMKQFALRDMSPVVICESKGTMAKDALAMKKAYEEYKKLI